MCPSSGLCWSSASLLLFLQVNQRNITAKYGDNVTLPCRTHFSLYYPIEVEWSKTDQKSDQVVFFQRYGRVEDKLQSPFFRKRVHLLYRRNRDVSLVLENVTTNDTGTYECRVEYRGGKRRKRSILKTKPSTLAPQWLPLLLLQLLRL
uniref:Ig-like domain-containing protein n=1 Tax=Fundulus heteroclitus TaxID=8078 RepID=A0A3Q2PWP3_FUNHE